MVIHVAGKAHDAGGSSAGTHCHGASRRSRGIRRNGAWSAQVSCGVAEHLGDVEAARGVAVPVSSTHQVRVPAARNHCSAFT
jgi:hypothetical protein